MKSPIDKETSEIRVMRKYGKVYIALRELVDALQNLGPGGTLIDEAVFIKEKNGQVKLAYKERPIQLSIDDGQRRFSLRVDELD